MLGVVKALQSDKIDHKLFVGNIPNDISQTKLVDVLNKALKKLGIYSDRKLPPIASAWISPDSQYAFIEFITKELAEKGMDLNNVSIFGKPLRVGKAAKYGISKVNDNSSNILGLLGIDGEGGDHRHMDKPFKISAPSRILVLLHIMNDNDVRFYRII